MDPAHISLQNILQIFNDPEPIRNRAADIFDFVLESKTLGHKYYDLIAAICVQLARRENGILLTPHQINVATGLSMKRLRKCEMAVQRTLHPSFEKIVQPAFMNNFCTSLHLPEAVHAAATQIIENVVNVELHRNFNGTTLALTAAAVYKASQASDTPKTMLEVAQAAYVREGDVLQANELLLLLPGFM